MLAVHCLLGIAFVVFGLVSLSVGQWTKSVLKGGHGALNILPQKRWNVYRRDNRLIVEQDTLRFKKQEELMQRDAEELSMRERYDQLIRDRNSQRSEEVEDCDARDDAEGTAAAAAGPLSSTTTTLLRKRSRVAKRHDQSPPQQLSRRRGDDDCIQTVASSHEQHRLSLPRRTLLHVSKSRNRGPSTLVKSSPLAYLDDWRAIDLRDEEKAHLRSSESVWGERVSQTVLTGRGNHNLTRTQRQHLRYLEQNRRFEERDTRNFYLPGLVPVQKDEEIGPGRGVLFSDNNMSGQDARGGNKAETTVMLKRMQEEEEVAAAYRMNQTTTKESKELVHERPLTYRGTSDENTGEFSVRRLRRDRLQREYLEKERVRRFLESQTDGKSRREHARSK
mmetsp:Transcript_16311/g.26475  ORF Transcript_16311/g.26475 Transcript_16311/m.26475 type:complete len:391 (-) Transcript_16311:65-1237(-)